MMTDIFAKALEKVGVNPIKADILGITYGGELLGYLGEIPIDLIFTKLGSKITKFLVGLAGTIGAYKFLDGKVQTEAFEVFSRFLINGIDPHIDDIPQLMSDIENLKRAISFGDWSWIRKSLIYSPDELTAKINSLLNRIGARTLISSPTATTYVAPTPTPAPKTETTPKIPENFVVIQ